MLTSEIAIESSLAFHSRIRKMPIIMKQAASENSPAVSPSVEGEFQRIETRFGIVEVSRKNPLVFEHGLLGVPNSHQYALVDFPSEKMGHFKILQSLDEMELSFITLPLPMDNQIIERGDLEKATTDIGISAENMAVLLIVSVHRTPSEVRLSVNARAPLLIDTTNRYAMQYVFQHSRYKVQHMLNTN